MFMKVWFKFIVFIPFHPNLRYNKLMPRICKTRFEKISSLYDEGYAYGEMVKIKQMILIISLNKFIINGEQPHGR